MNERIKELAEQAGAHYLDVKNEATAMVNIEAFAELIVMECAGFVDGYNYDTGNEDTGDELRKHFGLKECE